MNCCGSKIPAFTYAELKLYLTAKSFFKAETGFKIMNSEFTYIRL